MAVSSLVTPTRLIEELQILCGQPSTTGVEHELESMANVVAQRLRTLAMEVVIHHGMGAPVVMAYRPGRTNWTLLLYHHYDLAPPGPWRVWLHEPFQVAERDGLLYGRGVAHGKGPLAAHITALRTLIETDGELPCGIMMVIEGEGLSGSATLGSLLAHGLTLPHIDGCIGVGGERNAHGRPFCYSGSKGLLQVRLSTRGPAEMLPAGMAASVRNPIWRLVWALTNIKGDDEEIKINGFYDSVEGPNRSDNATLRRIRFDEEGRKAAWGVKEFLFGMSGAALAQSEVTLPTCNLTAFISGPDLDLPGVPSLATAHLDFQLVPHQKPMAIMALLDNHLRANNMGDILLHALPGGYPAYQCGSSHPFVEMVAAAGTHAYEEPLIALLLAPTTQPVALLAAGGPVAMIGFARHDNNVRSANEHLPFTDLTQHSNHLIALLQQQRALG